MTITVVMVHPDAHPDHVGFIPDFLHEDDPRPAREQFAERYIGGWWPLPGCSIKNSTLRFPGDPPFRPIAAIPFRDEIVMIYEHAFVAIVQPDGTFEVARMD